MESVIEFKLPALGENIEQGDLVRLMIAPGATVSEGQAVMELETDKAVVEVPPSISGTVDKIMSKEGDKIKVGQVIFTAENNGASAAAAAKETPRKEEPGKPAGKAQPKQASSGSSGASSPTGAAAAKPQPARSSQAESRPQSQPAPQRTRSTDGPAASEFRLQELGENVSEGDLVGLMIAPGAKVSEGQPVMELETDKAVVEVPSSVSGTVNEIRVKEGEKVKVGQVIFTVENGSGAKAKPAETKPAEAKVAEAKPAEAEARKAPAAPAAPPPTEPPPAPPPPVAAPRAAPAASGPSQFKMPERGENISECALVRL